MDILANPWVVGIGTAIIAGLVLYYAFGIGRTKHMRHKTGPESHPQPVTNSREERGSISSVTPKQIVKYLRSLPPLQTDLVANNYKGIKVRWKVNLETARPLAEGKLHLMLLNRGEYPWVICEVESKRYPELGIIKKNTLFTIQGEIESVDEGTIHLKDCQLYF
jgi:hypothetical protein